MSQPFNWQPLAAAMLICAPARAQEAPPARPAIPYAAVAELAVGAPVILQGTVKKATRLKGDQAVGVPPGTARFLIRTTVTRLIAGRQGVPGEISYLVDLPLDARGRPPKPRKANLLLFLKPVPGRDDQFTLLSPNAHLPWTAALDATTLAIVKEAHGPLGSLTITGIGNAFHVPGSISGRVPNADILDHSGSAAGIAVGASQARRNTALVRLLGRDRRHSDAPAGRDTLLWYKLACFLPPELPADLRERLGEQRVEVEADYRFIIDSLGPCRRQ